MKLILKSGILPNAECVVEHKGYQIGFSAIHFANKSKGTNNEPLDTFEHLNEYLACLPEHTLDEIFAVMQQARDRFDYVVDNTPLHHDMAEISCRLLSLFNLQHIRTWLVYKSTIIIPDSFSKDFIEDIDSPNSRDKTYLRDEYIDLVCMAIALRIMIPIWGQFINLTKKASGTDYKDYFAVKLIAKSHIVQSKAWLKLQEFIDKMIGADRYNKDAIINSNISSEDYPQWIMSFVITRRVCVGDIRGTEPRANLVTFIWKFVAQKIKGEDASSENRITEKEMSNKGNGADIVEKLSALERYKIKHDQSLGELMEIEFYVGKIDRFIRVIQPDLELSLYHNARASVEVLRDRYITMTQIRVLQWIMEPAISPESILYISRNALLELMALGQAVLWHRSRHYMALFLTCMVSEESNEYIVGTSDTTSRLTKENIDELNRLYPNFKYTGKRSNSKPYNLAIKTIENTAKEITGMAWNMTADSELIKQVFQTATSRRLPLNGNLKNILAEMIIEIQLKAYEGK